MRVLESSFSDVTSIHLLSGMRCAACSIWNLRLTSSRFSEGHIKDAAAHPGPRGTGVPSGIEGVSGVEVERFIVD